MLMGKYTMTGEAFDPFEVGYGPVRRITSRSPAARSGASYDKSTYDPTDDIEAYALNASGVVNIIVFDPKALGAVPFLQSRQGEAGYPSYF